MKNRATRPLTFASLYGVFATLWILFSSLLLAFVTDDPQILERIELGKGLLFVAVTTSLLFFVLREKQHSAPAIAEEVRSDYSKSIFVVILAMLLVVPLTGYGILRFYVPLVEQRTYSELNAVSELQADNIQLWKNERINDFRILENSSAFQKQISDYFATGSRHAQSQIENALSRIHKIHHYNCIALYNVSNTRQFLVGDERYCPDLSPVLATLSSREFTGIQFLPGADTENDLMWANFIVPLSDRPTESTSGFIVANSYPHHYLRRDISHLPGHYQSIETLLLRQDKDQVHTFHISEKIDNKKTLLKTPLSKDALATLVLEGGGDARHIRAKDHHQREVLAVARPFDMENWMLVSKVDRSEALDPVKQLAMWLSIVVLAALLAISVALLIIWRQQRRTYLLSSIAKEAQHERDLRKLDADYRELFYTNPNPMWLLDRETGVFLAVNDAAVEHYGYSREQFLSHSVDLLTPPANLQGPIKDIPPKYANIDRHAKSDGAIIYVEISSHDIDFDGRKANLILAYDLTEKLLAEQRLLESDRFANCTLDSLPMNIAVLDETGCIITTNNRWQEFSEENNGASDKTGIGVNYLEIARQAVGKEHGADMLVSSLEALLAGQIPHFNYEYTMHDNAGQSWYLAFFNRFQDDGPIRIVVSHENITARKRTELELTKINRYYAAISEMNAAIVRSQSQKDMLRKVCEIAVKQIDFELAWVSGISGRDYEVLASFGSARGYIEEVITQDASMLQKAAWVPGNEAFESRRTLVFNNLFADEKLAPWRERLTKWNLNSFALCPIIGREQAWGVIAFYSATPGFFTDDLVELLDQLTADLAYALDMAEIDRRRQQTQSDLLLNAKIIEASHEGMFITDHLHRFTMVNKAFCALTGYTEDELLGNRADMLQSSEESAAFQKEIQYRLKKEKKWQGETLDRNKTGETYPAWVSITEVTDSNTQQIYHVGVYRDITEQKEYEEKIKHLATHDVLTDLPNRVLLDDRIDQAMQLANRHSNKLALLFIDLDKFKLINDTLGHNIGDKLLREVARRIMSVLRSSDSVSRVGGDEFIVLLKDIDSPQDAALVSQKIIEAVATAFDIDNHHLVLTCSIGIAVYPDNGNSAEGLTRLADLAMISAKQSGYGRHQFYSGEMGASAEEYLALQNELRNALTRNQIYLVYQPQYLLEDNKVIGVEALARWRHHKLGEISPDRFIPVAEDSGLIIDIGTWVLTEACRQAQKWHTSNTINVPVSVNVSAVQFRQPDFVDTVISALTASELPPSMLELEVTESVLMREIDDVLDKLNQLNQLGINIAIDDFGTGYSSLAYLRQFPANRLKIDKSFVIDLPDSNDAIAIVQAVISLGNALNMDIIAEGIENQQQADFLANMNCHIGQGFHFALPMEAARFESWFRRL